VTSGACDAIARPDQHDAEAAAAGSSHHLIETRPFPFVPEILSVNSATTS
jgi:hypothetical protein